MIHIHTLVWVPGTSKVVCEGCDVRLRLATYDESNHVQATGDYGHDGPMEFTHGAIVVPVDYRIPDAVPA